jgi:predicted metal-dependent HD superfamily phosphohydrolase
MSNTSNKEWSKLTPVLTDMIRKEYDKNGLEYHNWQHIEFMYECASLLKIPYSHALDFAIAFHDIVHDELPNKEQRSAEYMIEMLREALKTDLSFIDVPDGIVLYQAKDLIMRTANHEFVEPIDYTDLLGNYLVLLDLAGFSNGFCRDYNSSLIYQECKDLYDIDYPIYCQNSLEFMIGLRDRLQKSLIWCPLSNMGGDIIIGIQACITEFQLNLNQETGFYKYRIGESVR